MATLVQPDVLTATTVKAPRVASLDIFRGLTMAVMIFVNDLDSVKGLPWWTYHASGKIDVMTYVDMVFPAFLFILGMSIPLAVEQRLRKDPSLPHLWMHILLRAFSLLVLGLILANASGGDPARIHMPPSVWTLLALFGALLVWQVDPHSDLSGNVRQTLFRPRRVFGALLIAAMFALFRHTTREGSTTWIQTAYPEILGLLAFAYLTTCILYIPTRRWRWAPFVWFAILSLFCILSTAKLIPLPGHASLYLWPFHNGSSTSISMAGVATSMIFVGRHSLRWPTFRSKAAFASGFAAAALVAGGILTPLGISKIRATPTWCLYSIGISILVFTFLYWVADVRRYTGWALFVRSAGSNTLLTYLLPDIWYFALSALGITWFHTHFVWGTPGVLRAAAFTALMLALSSILTSLKVRLQL